MTARESRSRPVSWSSYASVALLCGVYGAGLCIVFGAAFGPLQTRGLAACGTPSRIFAPEGRAGIFRPHAVQDATDRLLVATHDRFPYSLSGHSSKLLDEYPIQAIGVRDGDAGYRVVPRVDYQPLRVTAGLVWRDKILLSGPDRARSGSGRDDVHYVVDRAGESQVLRGRGLLRPLAVDELTDTMISLEERPVMPGGHPREAERPPQRLVFERLDEAGLPQREGASDLPIRRLSTLLSDDQGNVYIARWQGESLPPSYAYEAYVFLEKYSIPQQQIVWSVQINAEPMASDRAERLRLGLTSAGIRIEIERWTEADPEDSSHETRLVVQSILFDTVTGALAGEDLFEDSNRAIVRDPEVVLGDRTYAISSHLGIRRSCIGLTEIEGS